MGEAERGSSALPIGRSDSESYLVYPWGEHIEIAIMGGMWKLSSKTVYTVAICLIPSGTIQENTGLVIVLSVPRSIYGGRSHIKLVTRG